MDEKPLQENEKLAEAFLVSKNSEARDIYWFYQRNKDLHQQVAPAAVTKYKKHLSKNSEWSVVK